MSAFLAMACVHAYNTVTIYRNPAVCCDERRKAAFGVLDSVCCMVSLSPGRYPYHVRQWPDSACSAGDCPSVCKQTRGADESNPHSGSCQHAFHGLCGMPYVLCTMYCSWSRPFHLAWSVQVHGWAIPFGGFRLSADIYLHLLNVQVYLFTKLQFHGMHNTTWPIPPTALLAFLTCTLIPVAMNIVFEANIRAAYLARRNLPANRLSNFWHQVLRWGVATRIQADNQSIER